MIYWCLLSGYVLITLVRRTLQVTAHCTHVGVTGDGLKEVVCTKPSSDPSSVLPNNIPYDVEVLRLDSLIELSMEVNTFSQFIDLKRIIIERTYFVDKNWISRAKSPEWFDDMHKNLFADTNIVDITLHECHLRDDNVLKYPSVIVNINLTGNNYFKIDLTGYEDLEKVNLANNYLKSFPQFTDPSPSIHFLNLKYNQLNISVGDIAHLCSLRKLELSNDMALNTLESKCECERMTNWSIEANFTITGLDNICFPYDEADCSSYTLDEARKKRQNCIRSNTGLPYLHRVLKRYYFRILVVLFGLLMFAIVVYTIYRIHRGTLEGDEEGKKSKASSAAGEEGEEEEEEERSTF